MDPLTAVAASGLRARMESLELLANNLANAGTTGYKSDREFYGVYRAAEADESGALMPLIERHWTDFTQGTLEPTARPLDLAIAGKGFFAVNGPSGPLYTRNGGFRLSPAGRLETADGYAVRGTGGAAVVVDPGRPVEISRDGTVRQEGNVAGKLEVVEFANSASLAKQGNTYFRNTDAANQPAEAAAASVEQGKLETSNTGAAEGAVRLVSVMRQFEILQKAVGVGNEMNRRGLEEVARVGS